MRFGHILGLAVALAWALASRGSAASVATTAVAWAASASNQIGLVVDFGNGVVVTQCVQFVETQLTGYDVLNRSGLALVVGPSSGMGVSVCKINNTGCSASLCFCAMPNYWSYWQFTNGAWVYSMAGASSTVLLPGAVEGWRWGATTPPQVRTFAQVCGPTSAPTATAIIPTASATNPPPTATSIPATNTPVPTVTPYSRVLVAPATSTSVPGTATPVPTPTSVPPSATPSPLPAILANVSAPTPSDTPAPVSTDVASTSQVSPIPASPMNEATEVETAASSVIAHTPETPSPLPSATAVAPPEAAAVGAPSASTPSGAALAPSLATATAVPVARLRQDLVSPATTVATRVPTRPPLLTTVAPLPVAPPDASPQRSNLPVGYVVFGVAILALLIYLFGGRRDP